MYGTRQSPYLAQPGRTNINGSNFLQPVMQPEPEEDEGPPPLFCRALYDYEAQDASALSFRRGDVMQILSKQPSGWWDGLLDEERGWFPSNYVVEISEEEADLALSGSDPSNTEFQNSQNRPISTVDMAMAMGSQSENEDWLDNELSQSRNGVEDLAQASWQRNGNGTSSSDFWMPQVAPNGQIFYVNTHTGQQSRDLPTETEDEASDSDLAGLTSQSSSRSGTSAGLGLAANDSSQNLNADFNTLLHSSGTPEPWVKRLADDGMSYYYYNKVDGSVQWTRPERPANGSATTKKTPVNIESTRLLPTRPNGASNRLSVYSDTSDVQPDDSNPVRSLLNGSSRGHQNYYTEANEQEMQLTSAELIAQSLQQVLAPGPPELLPDLSASAKDTIQTVVDHIRQYTGSRRIDDDHQLDRMILAVVQAVRNLLYVSAVPSGQIPASVLPKEARNLPSLSSSQSPLKPAQRKVTATLSRLVLSARAMQYDSGTSLSETLKRIEVDAEELERAVLSFVLEVQRNQHSIPADSPEARPLKRLRGMFMTANIGLGLPGAGAAGSWKGFGWVSLENGGEAPKTPLSTEVVTEAGTHIAKLDKAFIALGSASRSPDESPPDLVRLRAKDFVTQISTLLSFISNIHLARHVDIDGIHHEATAPNDMYTAAVDKARILVRTLETAVQSLYDDGSSLLMATQSMHEADLVQSRQDRAVAYDNIDIIATSLKANLALVQQTLEGLLTVGHEQADLAQGDYTGSIEWRMSRLSVIDTQFGGALRPLSAYMSGVDGVLGDYVDMEHAFSRPATTTRSGDRYDSPYQPTLRNGTHSKNSSQVSTNLGTGETTLLEDLPAEESDDDALSTRKSQKSSRTNKERKLRQMMGDDIPEAYLAWYLQPNTVGVLIEPDGSVRGGTLPALVEQLTAHDHADPTYIQAFLMTFKSFMTLDELFDLLVKRFWIQPPPKLTPSEFEQWGKLKQHVIRTRVLNVFKSMVVEQDILEKEDLYILERMKEFVSKEEVYNFAAAKQLLVLVERVQKGGEKVVLPTSQAAAPQPVIPKGKQNKLKLLDIDSLELARQLTLFESQLYQKIRPMECLLRAREQKAENNDNITVVIQTSNRIANWVADSILSREDSRRRANVVKHLISVADRCRTLNNFSTMIAITSGLNTPPIRRLKRTWEQVSQRYMAQFAACEMTIDSNRNFNKYRSLMATVNPPCVPFIGVFLSTLQFIQDGNPDFITDVKDSSPDSAPLINFKKRQKASEVINDIKRWQAQSFNFVSIPSVQAYIEESLSLYSDSKATSEHFWELSLDREPREREDEKMARLLQESGFL